MLLSWTSVKVVKILKGSTTKRKKFCNEHRCTVQLILWLQYSHLSLTLHLGLTDAKTFTL